MTENIIQLEGDERILLEQRTHWKNFLVPAGALTLCLAFAIFRFRHPAPILIDIGEYDGTDLNNLLSKAAAVTALLLAFTAAVTALNRFCEKYIITTRRLIHHEGVFNTRTAELSLRFCGNLVMSQSLTGKILGYGDFTVRSGGINVFIDDVPRPLNFKRVLSRAIENAYRNDNAINEQIIEQDMTK